MDYYLSPNIVERIRRTHNVTPEIHEIWPEILATWSQWHPLAIFPNINEMGQRMRQITSRISVRFAIKSKIALRIPIVRIGLNFYFQVIDLNNRIKKSSNIFNYFLLKKLPRKFWKFFCVRLRNLLTFNYFCIWLWCVFWFCFRCCRCFFTFSQFD